ncbi:DNA helicase RecQ [Paenibacillus koleovorans]|uniref:DNA helicase RecQ n=1 Tax=Paenibacillus koleovorans TaxID=121608 RepID=UPI000FD9F1F1|nr:DNA helicase RecQ [Paenibacillus koleovorans]
MNEPLTMDQARRVLQRIYGYPDFREGQKQIIRDILDEYDTLGIMPTGGGKSICYQVPALLFPGTTIVVSPLISLMKDQVDALDGLGIPATYINSSLTGSETSRRLRAAAAGEYKLLYVAPERLETDMFATLAERLDIPFVAIDEAHCVSQWGHDFRTSYLAIAPFLRRMPHRPRLAAFTATATENVRTDIVRLLALQEPQVHVTGFDRSNLSFSVLKGVNRDDYVDQYVTKHADQAGIVYAATRKEVDQVHQQLKRRGIPAGKYHAGMTDDERKQMQERFLRDDIRVMVATNAFGMGIDKSNVRYVIHWSMPKNMEAYYQEAGRAGRDGEPGECVLLYQPQDILLQKFLIEQSVSSPERKQQEYRKMQQMIDYCITQNCLRSYILSYFGERPEEGAEAARCGNCGNCNDDSEVVDMTLESQQIMSCIRRMNERFGVTLVAQVLKGSSNKRVLEFRFDRLPTYGLMKQYPEKTIVDMIQLLIADGYIGLTESQYPVLRLLQPAADVLRGEKRVMRKVRLVKRQTRTGDELFDRLRALRKQLADRDGVPPYVVFADSALREMAEQLPETEEQLLLVKGVGQAKLAKYGAPFLDAVRAYAAESR